jgi:carbonic anhydrase
MRFLLILILIGISKCKVVIFLFWFIDFENGFLKGAPGGRHWNYGSEGPDFWKEEFRNCKGQKQSPIDITQEFLEYDSNLKQISFSNYDIISKWNVSHNGHTGIESSAYFRIRFLLFFGLSNCNEHKQW